jgi:hypothetical protein
MYVTWFTYDPSAIGTWYLMIANLNGTAVSGNLAQYTGTIPSQYNPSAATPRIVGNATLSFTGPLTATFTYVLNGIGGTLNLQRFTFATVNAAGNYIGASAGSRSGCSFSSNNGSFSANSNYVVSISGGNLSVQATSGNTQCTYAGNYSQYGNKLTASGNYSCNTGIQGTFNAGEITVTDTYVELIYTAQVTVGETCGESGAIGGVKQ